MADDQGMTNLLARILFLLRDPETNRLAAERDAIRAELTAKGCTR